MRKKLLVILLSGTMLTGLMTGCGIDANEQEGGSSQETTMSTDKDSVIVTMPVSSEPEVGFDPAYGWGSGENPHEPLIQSTLTKTTTDLKIENDLATDYSVSEDGLTWTVHIRDDVRFTDGEKLTAKDVAFTYNNCRDNNNLNDFTMLKEAVAVDDTTVEFLMNTPFTIWPYTMAGVGIVPEHGYDESYGEHPVGSGRYIMKQWDKGKQIIFEANPDYYGEEIKIKKLTVLFLSEQEALEAAREGQVDVAHTAATYADQEITGYNLQDFLTVDTRGFNLPTVEETDEDGNIIGNDVTSDLAIRRAINIGIDREELVDKVLGGYGTPAFSVCDKTPWYQVEANVQYDPEEAKQILEDAGWQEDSDGYRERDGQKAEFTLVYDPSDSVHQELAQELAEQLKKIGIKVNAESEGWDTYYDIAQSQAVIWGCGDHTPMDIYNIYHTDKDGKYAKYSPYSNPVVDQYLDEALEAPSLETSYEYWQKAQWDGETGINGDLPWIWLCNVDHLYFVKDGLEVGEQKVHPYGQGWSMVNNVDQWEWTF
mgnify:CR=1 FL=1